MINFNFLDLSILLYIYGLKNVCAPCIFTSCKGQKRMEVELAMVVSQHVDMETESGCTSNKH